MLNYIWGFMILVGVVYGVFTGNIEIVGTGIIDSAGEAVSLSITMLGITALWSGIMEIATKSGLVNFLTAKFARLLKPLFPGIPKGHKAWEYISLNFIANILGLGWAATPAGLKAMKELKQLHESECRLRYKDDIASNAMCTFLIINISSLQLIPINIIAYRSQYGSTNPAAVIMPSILATCISTFVAVLFCVIMNRRHK